MRLVASGLGHRFGGRPWLFRRVDLELAGGDLVALIGPSGSGKSTLLAILAGWILPAEGTVGGDDVVVGWVPQNPFGVPRRLVLDHAAQPLVYRGCPRAEAEREGLAALASFGLAASARRPFADLSGGEAQRLMLAQASVSPGSLVLVDEPTAQLDRTSAATVVAHLGALAARDRAVVVATHDPVLAGACSRTIDLGAWQDSGAAP